MPLDVLLLSTYELGHQPLGLARPAAHLRAAGHRVVCRDLAVARLDEAEVRQADLVAISVPMHTATRLAVAVAERVRQVNPRAHRVLFGLYASLNAEGLLGSAAESVVGGEFETPLVGLANALADGLPLPAGVATRDHVPPPSLSRQTFLPADRSGLPRLDRYARLDSGQGQPRLAGYVEASRGCVHRCLHCPIPPVYNGRMRVVPEEVVLEDVRRLVELGAEHVTFGDPDFFNGIRHSLRIVEAVHAAFPGLTYDVTIKVEHLLEHRAHLPLLRQTGCLFVVSAFEAVDDAVLGHLRKGHTATDEVIALGLARAAGLTLRPTFVPFTPWTSLDGYRSLLDFLERHGLVRHVDPVQLAIRLLVPRGSALLDSPAMQPHLGPFDPTTLTYTWRHPDPRLDDLQRRVAGVVEMAASDDESPARTFERVRTLADRVDGRATRREPVAAGVGAVPRLTEPWFC